MDVITALKAMTIWPAWQHFEDTTKGSIENGKLADFVILSDDPTAVDPDRLDQIEIVETIKEGLSVYQSAKDLADTQAQAMTKAAVLSRMLRAMHYQDNSAQTHNENGWGGTCGAIMQLSAALTPIQR